MCLKVKSFCSVQRQANTPVPTHRNHPQRSQIKAGRLLDAISDFGLQSRRQMYNAKHKGANPFISNPMGCCTRLLDCLDDSVLADLYATCNPQQQSIMHTSFLVGMDELQEAGFPNVSLRQSNLGNKFMKYF